MEHVIVTLHAHKQYCSRVEKISYEELNRLVNEQYRARDWTYNRRQFIYLNGVWWVKDDSVPGRVVMVTCYGKSHMDIPAALTWAARHNDRLVLDFG